MRLKDVKGVGAKTLAELNSLGIYDVSNLMLRFPSEYKIYEPEIVDYYKDDIIYIEGTVDSRCALFKFRGKSYAITFALRCNENVRMKCILFSIPQISYSIKQGSRIGVEGKYNHKDKCFNVRKLFLDPCGFRIDVLYKFDNILDSTYKRILANAISAEKIDLTETMPKELLTKYRLIGINEYIYKSHFPETKNDIIEVLRRRKYEEFFWYSIELDLIGNYRFNNKIQPRIKNYSLANEFLRGLSFVLTEDQAKAISDVSCDLGKDYTMNRLIQGDVGCGKTIVAIASAFMMVKSGFQVAVMAPTEVLARQEYNEFKNHLEKYNITCGLLTSSIKGKERGMVVGKLSQGNIDILVGTHALIEDSVMFNHLGLVIIDEQHRFGVNQRLKLVEKNRNVDSLFLTATPIPRTLGLTFFSELDITSIHSMPSNRKQIVTKILNYNDLDKMMVSITNHINMGEQCYVVVPLIEENEELSYIDVDSAYDIYSKKIPNAKIATIHGKMSAIDKDTIMNDFKNHNIDILISTTVIEVGVNVPNSTMMIIMDAERFGLATLHQLRGRVGRGNKESFCMLVTNDILNPRLNIISSTTDGFRISEEDFNLRGPGDYLGVEQSGLESLQFSSFQEDVKILECAKEDSKQFLPLFLKGEISSHKFNEIVTSNKNQKSKIN